MAIIYEFGTVPAKQIQYDLAVLRSQARNQLVREIVLLLNHCKNHDTVDEAKSIVKSNGDTMKMIVLESDERMVSHSRARSEAVKHTDAQYLLFLTAGQVPTSSDFLGNGITTSYTNNLHEFQSFLGHSSFLLLCRYVCRNTPVSKKVWYDSKAKVSSCAWAHCDYLSY